MRIQIYVLVREKERERAFIELVSFFNQFEILN